MTWTDANKYCMSTFGTTLAVIQNENENNDVCKNSETDCWIGLRRETKYGAFKWIGKIQSTYKNWNVDAPKNNNWNEGCGAIGRAHHYWYDSFCDHIFYFSCNLPWYMGTSPSNFENAMNYCKNKNTELASVTNVVQAALLQELLLKRRETDSWIGFYRKGSINDYYWLDGSTTKYLDWGSGQPDGASAYCAEQIRSTGKWNDIGCGNVHQIALCNSEFRDVVCNDCAGV